MLERSFWPADTSTPVLETTVGSVLRAAAAEAPQRTAVIVWGAQAGARRTWTYADLLRDAERVARALLRDFAPGEHVAVYAGNCAEWLLLEFGAGLAGLVLVTVNPANRARELEYVLRQSRAAGLFHAREFRGNPLAQWAGEVCPNLPGPRRRVDLADWEAWLAHTDPTAPLPEVAPDAPAQLQYTSGTTGAPKGALLSHRSLTNNARFYAERYELRAGDLLAHAMPMFHTVGCVLATLGSLQSRATHAFLPSFDAARLIELCAAERATHLFGVPTMLLAMLERPELAQRDLSALRVVSSGGASVVPELVRTIESRLRVRFTIAYGQTECSPVITQTTLDDTPEDKAETVGRAVPQTEVKIVDPASGEIVPIGATGEVCTRGYHVMRGYYDLPQATATAIDADGWLHTGDLGTLDARGYCRITGRLKDMVIRGGENLFPAEIEAVLHEYPGIAEVAIIGVPDARMGEELAAFVRTSGARLPVDALRRHVRERLAAPKAPRYWVYVDDFPLTGSGKIQKFVLRERWAGGAVAAVDAASATSATSTPSTASTASAVATPTTAPDPTRRA